MVRIFDVQSGKVIPSEHCYTLATLKRIMDDYPDPQDYLAAYQVIFYMTCPNPEFNPFFNVSEEEKQALILSEVNGDFQLDDPAMVEAIKLCETLYQTPTYRMYMGIKKAIDKLGKYLDSVVITDGQGGNINSVVTTTAKFDQMRNSFSGAYKDLMEEQKAVARGGQQTAYDQQ